MNLDFSELTPAQSCHLAPQLARMDPWHRLGFQADTLTSYLNRPDAALSRHAIMLGDQLAGALALRSPWLRGPYLELLAVFPQFQGQGIGSQALDWAFTHALAVWATDYDVNWPADSFDDRFTRYLADVSTPSHALWKIGLVSGTSMFPDVDTKSNIKTSFTEPLGQTTGAAKYINCPSHKLDSPSRLEARPPYW